MTHDAKTAFITALVLGVFLGIAGCLFIGGDNFSAWLVTATGFTMAGVVNATLERNAPPVQRTSHGTD